MAADRTTRVGRSDAAGFEVRLREYRGGLRSPEAVEGGVQTLSLDGDRVERRDAGLGALRARSGLCRRANLARLARRISGDLENADKPCVEGLSKRETCLSSRRLSSVLWFGSGAFRWLTKGEP